MNIYVSKYNDVWELALGNNPEEALHAMDLYFDGSQSKVEDMELYGKVHGEDRSYYYGYVDSRNNAFTAPTPDLFKGVYGFQHPCFYLKLIDDLQYVLDELDDEDDAQYFDLETRLLFATFYTTVEFSELVDEDIFNQLNRKFIDLTEAEDCIKEAIKQLQNKLPDLREEVYNVS